MPAASRAATTTAHSPDRRWIPGRAARAARRNRASDRRDTAAGPLSPGTAGWMSQSMPPASREAHGPFCTWLAVPAARPASGRMIACPWCQANAGGNRCSPGHRSKNTTRSAPSSCPTSLTPAEVARAAPRHRRCSLRSTRDDDAHRDLRPRGQPRAGRAARAPHQGAASASSGLCARWSRHPAIVAVLRDLWGPDIRFDTAKLNLKSAGFGAAVEWHQDWAFYPHTNDDLAAVGVMMDDMETGERAADDRSRQPSRARCSTITPTACSAARWTRRATTATTRARCR